MKTKQINLPDKTLILLTQLYLWNSDPVDHRTSWERTVLHFRFYGSAAQYKMALILARLNSPKRRRHCFIRKGDHLIQTTELIPATF